MAFQATPANIEDVLFGVVIFHPLLVMTLITIYRGLGSVVAARASASGVAMVGRESMVIHLDISPVIRVVAAGTFPRPVSLGPVMA